MVPVSMRSRIKVIAGQDYRRRRTRLRRNVRGPRPSRVFCRLRGLLSEQSDRTSSPIGSVPAFSRLAARSLDLVDPVIPMYTDA